jgi:hypothetical protein
MPMKIDYSVYLEDDLESWSDFVTNKGSLAKSFLELSKTCVDYPDYIYPLYASYALMPSAICKRVPILFLYGLSGSGKSTSGKLVACARNLPILSSSDSFASIRNNLNQMKHGAEDDEGENVLDYEYERNAVMVWDDLDPSALIDQPNIFRLLKFGCDRATQWISISSMKAGINMKFGTFTPKIISSVSPIWSVPKLSELERRAIVFPHKKSERTLANLDAINFSGFTSLYDSFWESTENCKRLNKKGVDPIYIDWISTGVALEYFDETEGVDYLDGYLSMVLVPIRDKSSLAFLELLRDFIETQTLISQRLGRCDAIDPSELIKACSQWNREGRLETHTSPTIIGEYMNKLGYTLTKLGWEKIDD